METIKDEKEIKQSAYKLFKQEKEKEAWKIISENENPNWTAEFIEINKDNLDWKALSFNDSLPWTIQFIREFVDRWDWHALSYIIADKQYFDRAEFELLLRRYKDKLDWAVICQGTNLDKHHLTDYAGFMNWDALSSNSRFTWSGSFLNKYVDLINWKVFTECLTTVDSPSLVQRAFRKKVLELFANKLDFDVLSANDSLDLTPEIIEKYKNRWDWAELINNPAIEWDEKMLRKYNKYISTIPQAELRVSYMWTNLIEYDAKIEFLLTKL